MMYCEGKWCISMRELEEANIISIENCKKLVTRKRVERARKGGGKGNCVMLVVDSFSKDIRAKIEEAFPGGPNARLTAWICGNYKTDEAAAEFYANKDKVGRQLSSDKRVEYTINASVLQTCLTLYNRAATCHRLFGEDYNWTRMATAIETLRERFGHTLPTSPLRFRRKANEFKRDGYIALVSGKFGNHNARMLSKKEERVILGLATLPNRPWNTHVREMYRQFACLELEVYDPYTGELLDPMEQTRTKDGDIWVPSEKTINDFLNRPDIKAFVARRHMPDIDYYHEMMPHVHRHGGVYSLSQVTMDDVDLPRRMEGNRMVHAYYAYDSVSGCVLAASYSRDKSTTLVDDCFRELFRLIKRRRWGIPAGIEVENHLMTRHKDGLLKEGAVFSKVRFCAPQNSQEKQAEALNGAKKRSVIHKNHEGIGRFYGKGKWRTFQKKVSDETNALWEDMKYYSYEQLVADDRADNEEWNNSPHPDQERYPGMTRWEVLVANINPGLRPYNEELIASYLGERVETSIRRNSTVRVCHRDWWLSSPDVLGKLAPNNYKVTARYLPTDDGDAGEVYIYQGGRCIDKLEPVETFNRVEAEQTEEDRKKFGRQMAKINAFRKYLDENAIGRVGVIAPERGALPEAVEAVPVAVADDDGWWDEPYRPAVDSGTRGAMSV